MGRKSTHFALLGAVAIALSAGCSTTPPASIGQDPSARTSNPDQPATPAQSWEPPSRTGNPESYKVFGKRYYVMNTSQGYRQRGIASWYGTDFHGKKTSSGIPYNMHDMTAAHKALPIPTQVRVTHLENGRSIVVKVNDRGPFVGDRIIDLSYAAATRLGMVKNGTAPVEVVALPPYQYLAGALAPKSRIASTYNEAPGPVRPAHQPRPAGTPSATVAERIPKTEPQALIRPPPPLNVSAAPQRMAVAPEPASEPPAPAAPADPSSPLYVQVGAFSLRRNAEHLQHQVTSHIDYQVHVHSSAADNLYKVRVGPLRDNAEAQQLVARLAGLGINAHAVASR
jgi:rare lipoprotein A